jgi:adenylosuccinate lyase
MDVFLAAHALIDRMVHVLSKLQVHTQSLEKHLKSAGSSVFAEAYYIMGTQSGVPMAHHVVREASREAEAKGLKLGDVLRGQSWLKESDDEIQERLMQGPRRKLEFLKQRLSE